MWILRTASCLLIPGPKYPRKDFNVFLESLIEELLQLWSGVMTYDAASRTKFNLHVAVLWGINDYTALGTLSGQSTKGYYACVHCDKNSLSQRLKNKLAYIGHRHYLPKDHDWRKPKTKFDGNTEEEAPEKFTAEEVVELLQRVSHVQPGVTDTGLKRKQGDKGERVIYNRKSAWWKLSYWKDLLLPHNLDVLHKEKNICDNLLGTLLK